MPPRVPVSSSMDIEADDSDLVLACRARLVHACRAADFSVQFPAPLTVAEGIGAVENVALVNEANEPRVPTLFEKSQIRSLFRLADIVAARLVRSPVVQQVAQPPVVGGGLPQPPVVVAAPHTRKIRVSDVLDRWTKAWWIPSLLAS